jgi:hypothetical protein
VLSPISPDLRCKPCTAPDAIARIGGWLGRKRRPQTVPALSESAPGPKSSRDSGRENKSASVGRLFSKPASSAKSESPAWGERGSLGEKRRWGIATLQRYVGGFSEKVQKKNLSRNPAAVSSSPESREIDETILPAGRSHPETSQCSHPPKDQTRGGDHVALHSQRDL